MTCARNSRAPREQFSPTINGFACSTEYRDTMHHSFSWGDWIKEFPPHPTPVPAMSREANIASCNAP